MTTVARSDVIIAATAGLAIGLSINFIFRRRRASASEEELVAARAYIAALTQRCEKAESAAQADPAKAQTAAVDAAKLAKNSAADVEALAAAVRAELAAVADMRKELAQHGAASPPSAAAIAAMRSESKPPVDNVSLASSSVATNGWVTPDEEPAWLTEAAEVVSPPKRSATEALMTGRRLSHESEDLNSEEAAYPVAAEQSLASSATLSADEPPSVLAEADRLNEDEAHRELMTVLDTALSKTPNDAELLWRLARCHKKTADAEGGGEAKTPAHEAHMAIGLRHATRALELAPDNGSCHKWYAILLGGKPGTTGEKIGNSFIVKEHFDKAAELLPKDATSRHLVGLWCYEVAKLSWFERKAAAALFAAPPEATYEEAYEHLAHAEKLEPAFYMNNRLLLCHCCVQLGKKDEARRWLSEVLGMEVKDADDEKTMAAAKKLRI